MKCSTNDKDNELRQLILKCLDALIQLSEGFFLEIASNARRSARPDSCYNTFLTCAGILVNVCVSYPKLEPVQ